MHYELTRSKRRRLIADYIQAGGQALEVVNGMMPAEQVGTMSILAREFGLLASAGSDFHGPGTWVRSVPTGHCQRTCHLCGVDSNMSSQTRPSDQEENVSQFFQIHAENPQPRLIKQAVEIIRKGGVVVYPTDSSYALGCQIGDKNAVERVRRLRQLDKNHNFTLICCDLSQMGLFAKIDTGIFRLLKAHIPGPYTFILNGTREVPRLLLHEKRRTIGLRVPQNPILLALLEELGEPLMSVSLILPGDEEPMTDPYEIRERLEKQVDLIIDGGYGDLKASTVVDLSGDEPEVIRVGCGDPAPFMVEA